jgi:hypothetical protein
MVELKDLNEKMLVVAKDLLETKGDINGGLYNFYKVRIEKGQMLSKYEIFVLGFVGDRYPKTCSILEAASGIGTVSHALSILGYDNVTSCEFDHRRNLANRVLGERLGSKAKVISDTFPSSSLMNFDLVILTNAKSSHNKYETLIEFIKSTKADLIMMPRLWRIETSYEQGCFLLKEAGISFEEIGFEMVYVKRS